MIKRETKKGAGNVSGSRGKMIKYTKLLTNLILNEMFLQLQDRRQLYFLWMCFYPTVGFKCFVEMEETRLDIDGTW